CQLRDGFWQGKTQRQQFRLHVSLRRLGLPTVSMRKAEKKPDLPASLKTGKYPLQNPFKNATASSKTSECTFTPSE
ncbi:TPA: hypothetical protein ACHGAX_RS25100, partial [Escherichia coli]